MIGILGEIDLEKCDMDTAIYLVVTLIGIGISWGSLRSKVEHITKHVEGTEKKVSRLHDNILLIKDRCPKFNEKITKNSDCPK